jgi:hypothetical protein
MTEGQFIAIGRIAWLEGGGKAGWKAAVNYCTSCIQLGEGWTLYDERAKRIKFKYVVDSREKERQIDMTYDIHKS